MHNMRVLINTHLPVLKFRTDSASVMVHVIKTENQANIRQHDSNAGAAVRPHNLQCTVAAALLTLVLAVCRAGGWSSSSASGGRIARIGGCSTAGATMPMVSLTGGWQWLLLLVTVSRMLVRSAALSLWRSGLWSGLRLAQPMLLHLLLPSAGNYSVMGLRIASAGHWWRSQQPLDQWPRALHSPTPQTTIDGGGDAGVHSCQLCRLAKRHADTASGCGGGGGVAEPIVILGCHCDGCRWRHTRTRDGTRKYIHRRWMRGGGKG